jgi:hypothetical protein
MKEKFSGSAASVVPRAAPAYIGSARLLQVLRDVRPGGHL